MNKKSADGITLIALVITIVILIVLAGVSIAMLTGENGILTKATSASVETKKQGAIEKAQIAVAGSYGQNGKLNYSDLKENINSIEGLEKKIEKELIDSDFPLRIIVDRIEILINSNGRADFNQEGKEEVSTGGEWAANINTPKITNKMTPVYWNEDGTEITGDNGVNWYNYDQSKWANVKMSDGSYFVWIPRYEYKILSGEGTNTAGEIDVRFIPTNKTNPDEGYKIHPAFTNGTANKYANGEWDKDIPGIWVAKFEMSMETNGAFTETADNTIGNVLLSDTVKAVSKPGVTSWRYIEIGNSYLNSYNYDREKESHMMKNSEWGAVVYLAQSKYGRNQVEIEANKSELFYTGGGEGDSFKTNIGQSTTNNISGIYDMAGGTWEQIPAYIDNDSSGLSSYGKTFATSKVSTKYTTVYPYDTAADDSANNYNIYKQSVETRYGDAVLETSSEHGKNGWCKDYSYYPKNRYCFFFRGGAYNEGSYSGMFSFYYTSGGDHYNETFRVCLAL